MNKSSTTELTPFWTTSSFFVQCNDPWCLSWGEFNAIYNTTLNFGIEQWFQTLSRGFHPPRTSNLSHGIRPLRRNKGRPKPDHKYHRIHHIVGTLFHILDGKRFLCTLSFHVQFAQVELCVLVSKGFKVFSVKSQLFTNKAHDIVHNKVYNLAHII